MRAFAMLVILLAPLAVATAPVVAPCAPFPAALADTSCAPIHPGARVLVPEGLCTLAFVVTDGVDLYLATAGHCVQGAGGVARLTDRALTPFGVVALDGARGDWAFVRVDPGMRALVDPTLAQWGGPTAERAPRAGEPVLHHGHGASLGQQPLTRGRAGAVLLERWDATSFAFAGSVDHGDSGSPVMAASGEALGIAVATVQPGAAPSVAVATRFDLAVGELADALGREVRLVEGRAPAQCACAPSGPVASV